MSLKKIIKKSKFVVIQDDGKEFKVNASFIWLTSKHMETIKSLATVAPAEVNFIHSLICPDWQLIYKMKKEKY